MALIYFRYVWASDSFCKDWTFLGCKKKVPKLSEHHVHIDCVVTSTRKISGSPQIGVWEISPHYKNQFRLHELLWSERTRMNPSNLRISALVYNLNVLLTPGVYHIRWEPTFELRALYQKWQNGSNLTVQYVEFRETRENIPIQQLSLTLGRFELQSIQSISSSLDWAIAERSVEGKYFIVYCGQQDIRRSGL